LFYDSENEEGMETLDEPDPLCLKIKSRGDLPSDDDIQILEALAQEGLSEVLVPPSSFKWFFDDTKSEKVLDVLADLDEFIHVGRRRWNSIRI
jgi:hypothetical protein